MAGAGVKTVGDVNYSPLTTSKSGKSYVKLIVEIPHLKPAGGFPLGKSKKDAKNAVIDLKCSGSQATVDITMKGGVDEGDRYLLVFGPSECEELKDCEVASFPESYYEVHSECIHLWLCKK